MPTELLPEDVLRDLQKGELAPFYLFYGLEVFRLEKVVDRIRTSFIPESARDLNLEIFYGGEINPIEIIDRARSVPFLAPNRLMIVRRTENFRADDLERFLRYLAEPTESTCLIFIASRTDFRKAFYSRIRALGRAVNFRPLKDNQIVPWIKGAAKGLGLEIDGQACACLQQIVGNRLKDLYAELEKLQLRYGDAPIGTDQVKELAIHSRVYTIFELMHRVSSKKCSESLDVLHRFLEEEDKRAAPLQILGMLNRQMRTLWQTKAILAKGGQTRDVANRLGLAHFSARGFVEHSRYWSVEELETALHLLYQADGLLKSGSRPNPVLENLVVSLCR